MELSKKTTILFPPALHSRLVEIAKFRGKSLGELVREACEAYSRQVSVEERLAAVERLGRMSAPVASVRVMKRQSVPKPEDLLP